MLQAVDKTLARMTASTLLARRCVAVSFTVTVAGKAADELSAKVNARGQLSAARGSKRVVFAAGTVAIPRAGTATISVCLSSRGRRLLAAAAKRHHNAHLANRATFTTIGSPAVTVTERVKLGA